jgi:pyruvate,water dikinase
LSLPGPRGPLGLDNIDIEWVLDTAGNLWLVQARPLTTPLPNTPAGAPPTSDHPAWQGIPASPGIGVGPAAHLRPGANPEPDQPVGCVLLCGPLGPEAVPALLAAPAAVISTTGGPLSHTPIIARELGIPCVTAVTNATTAIPPGATTRVDGTNGTVTLTGSAPTPPPAPADLSGIAILTTNSDSHTQPTDGRAATLLLYIPDDDPETMLAAPRPPGTPPTGILQPTEGPAFPQTPPGYPQNVIPGLGRLLWPTHIRLPTRIAALDPNRQILHHRTTPTSPRDDPATTSPA